MSKRGRKPLPCPDVDELRIAYAFDPRLVVVARQMSASVGQVRRWLGEIGVTLPEPRKQRAHGMPTRYVRLAYRPDGKRVVCRLYSVWINMKKRCYSPSNVNYPWYGARGIEVCAEWHDYDAFRAWAVANGFCKDITLDRVDVNGNYGPSNCRWVGRDVQQANKRRNGPVPQLQRPSRLAKLKSPRLGFGRGRKPQVPNEWVS